MAFAPRFPRDAACAAYCETAACNVTTRSCSVAALHDDVILQGETDPNITPE